MTPLAAISTGQAAIWAAAIGSVGGILTAALTVAGGIWKESQAFQRELISRLLTREESVLTPLVRTAENQQSAITTIGSGVADLLLAQKIEDGQRRRGDGGDD